MNLFTGQNRYRVYLDESYNAEKISEEKADKSIFAELRGAYGTVYPYSKTRMAVRFDSIRVATKHQAHPDWKLIQNGDFEQTYTLPDADWKIAAMAVKAKQRRQYSPAALARLQERGKNLSKKGLLREKSDEQRGDEGRAPSRQKVS